jgi:A/G-specific adenine glycosylase
VSALARWYVAHGRHELAWRATRDRWPILVSEVMLHQTQVPRVAAAWPDFIGRFPDPETMATAGPGAVITAWGRLGYPRRARRLWEASVVIAERGWPDDLIELPGVGRYTARAIAAQVDDADVPAVEVNVQRVVERVEGRRLTTKEAEDASVRIAQPLDGRDRLLALMDVGALLCRPREPRCRECPLRRRCAARGPLPHEALKRGQPRFEGSFRQRRGQVMARLRMGPVPVGELDAEALASLVADAHAERSGPLAQVASSRGREDGRSDPPPLTEQVTPSHNWCG